LFVREHLRRLTRVWIEPPIYFITICTRNRRNILTHETAASVLIEEWQRARERHSWAIGRYVIMPDHVHFFCRPEHEAKTLSRFIGAWKTWTSRKIQKARPQPTAAATTPQSLWQREFFDHLLRSSESYSEKWNYVRENPVRSGFVASADDWSYAGEIERLEF
jgi:REP element-mobilizing transposase RayT